MTTPAATISRWTERLTIARARMFADRNPVTDTILPGWEPTVADRHARVDLEAVCAAAPYVYSYRVPAGLAKWDMNFAAAAAPLIETAVDAAYTKIRNRDRDLFLAKVEAELATLEAHQNADAIKVSPT